MAQNAMEQRNKMTLRQAILQRDSFEYFIDKEDSKGVKHTFFTLGGESGYMSERAIEVLQTKPIKEAVDLLNYCECRQEGTNDWVPVLMIKGGMTPTGGCSASDL